MKNNKYDLDTIRLISHEIKNQLSICELYAEIIKKHCIKDEIYNMNIMNAVDCIKNSVRMSNNSLLELKSYGDLKIEKHCVQLVLEEAVKLSQVYGIQKNVKIESKISTSTHVLIDKTKFIATIINLVKNACEAFEDETSKNIFIKAEEIENKVEIRVSNNAKPIENPDKIFETGYTTKNTGNGLGLIICKSNIEKMNGSLELVKTDNISTEFLISISLELN